MRKLPKIISQEEFEKIFLKEKDKEYKLCLLLGFEAGMRISEIVGLGKLKSKCCDKEVVIRKREVDGKKVKKYFCYDCGKDLNRSNETRRSKNEWGISPLVKNKVGVAQIRIEQGKGEKDRIVPRPKRVSESALRLLPIKRTRRAIQWRITKLGKEVLGKSISFHTLRHGFGSHLANKGRPLHEIQMLMGHSRLDTTGIYLHANPEKALDSAREVF